MFEGQLELAHALVDRADVAERGRLVSRLLLRPRPLLSAPLPARSRSVGAEPRAGEREGEGEG